ncbi:MAG: LacI family DNA-binding transcriptional regulator [Treponema sp.]|jgi:DNA-binding LacI/PurR family transcriptional regulator|nr:LacI family DNA-binding transcriptional regulator [Treponema sp.]
MFEERGENPRAITSINVAYHAHVSQATVSRVLNEKGNVRKVTAEKVLAAMKELGYQPNAIARSLTNRKTDIVALVSVNSTHSFYVSIINNISQRLSWAGKRILYFQVKVDEDLEEIFKQVHQYQVDGMIIISAAVSPRVTEAAERINLPIAIFNRQIHSNNIYSVCSDNIKASRMVADYLADKGYKSFGFIGSTVMENISADRQRGFTDRLGERGFPKPMVEYGLFTYHSGWEAMRRMTDRQKLPEVIFSSNDLMAMGAMDFLRYDLKLSLPDDIGIIGFDAIEEGAWRGYNLSSVEQPLAGMIERICDYLLKRMNDAPVKEKNHLFPCKILERGTT